MLGNWPAEQLKELTKCFRLKFPTFQPTVWWPAHLSFSRLITPNSVSKDDQPGLHLKSFRGNKSEIKMGLHRHTWSWRFKLAQKTVSHKITAKGQAVKQWPWLFVLEFGAFGPLKPGIANWLNRKSACLATESRFPPLFLCQKKPCIAVAQVKYQEPHIQLDVVSCSRVNVWIFAPILVKILCLAAKYYKTLIKHNKTKQHNKHHCNDTVQNTTSSDVFLPIKNPKPKEIWLCAIEDKNAVDSHIWKPEIMKIMVFLLENCSN